MPKLGKFSCKSLAYSWNYRRESAVASLHFPASPLDSHHAVPNSSLARRRAHNPRAWRRTRKYLVLTLRVLYSTPLSAVTVSSWISISSVLAVPLAGRASGFGFGLHSNSSRPDRKSLVRHVISGILLSCARSECGLCGLWTEDVAVRVEGSFDVTKADPLGPR